MGEREPRKGNRGGNTHDSPQQKDASMQLNVTCTFSCGWTEREGKAVPGRSHFRADRAQRARTLAVIIIFSLCLFSLLPFPIPLLHPSSSSSSSCLSSPTRSGRARQTDRQISQPSIHPSHQTSSFNFIIGWQST